MADKISWRRKYAHNLLPVLLCIVDYIAVVAAESLSYGLRKYWLPIAEPSFSIPEIYILVIVPSIFLCFLHIAGTHVRNISAWRLMQNVFYACAYAVVLICVLMYFAKVGEVVSRLFVAMTWGFSFAFILFFRLGVQKLLNHTQLFQIPVLFVGAGMTAELVVDAFEHNPSFGYRIIGFVDDHPKQERLATRYKILGGFADVEDVIKATGVPYVIITAPGLSPAEQVDLVNRIQPLVKSVSFVPDFIGLPLGTLEAEGVDETALMLLRVRNNLAHWYNRALKRVFDLTIGLLGMFLVIPIGLIIGLCIYIDSPGAVIFSHRRIGQGGKEFSCYKFRSMIPNAQETLERYLITHPDARSEWERDFKLKDDPRITRVGQFLRKTSMDELPQMINVIKGEMSLVGPRPIVREEIEKYGEHFRDFCLVPPGITGMWQVNGRSDTTYEERVQMDSWYVRNWSVWIDMVYLAKTVVVVVRGKGAY